MATEKMKNKSKKLLKKLIHKILEQQIKEDQVADLMNALEKANQKDLLLIRLKKKYTGQCRKDRENLERILDELATKANRASAELDEVNAEIAGIKEEIKEVAEEIGTLDTKKN